MADTLRELVVSLSLQSDNFTRNIKSINTQIKEAESYFKAAGAGIEGFDQTMQGVAAHIYTLEQKLQLQRDIVQQTSQAYDAANNKLNESQKRLEQYRQGLSSLTNVQTAQFQALENEKAKYDQLTRAYGENSTAAQDQKQVVERLQAQFDATTTSIVQYRGQVESLRKATLNDVDAVANATTKYNAARGAVKETEAELVKLRETQTLLANGWDAAVTQQNNAQVSLANLSSRMKISEADCKKVAAELRMYAAVYPEIEVAIAQHENSLVHLQEQYKLQMKAIQQYHEVLEAAEKKQNAAMAAGDTSKVRQTQEEINNATAALKNAQAAAASTSAAIYQTETELAKLQETQKLIAAGWDDAVARQKNAEASLASLSGQMKVVDADCKKVAAEIKMYANTFTEVDSAIALHDNKLTHLREQYELQVRAIAQYKEALEAAQKKYDAAVTVGDAEKIKQAQEEINNATVALKNAQAAVASTRGEINQTEAELLKLQETQKLITAGWEDAIARQKNAESSLASLNAQMKVVDADCKKASAELQIYANTFTAVDMAIAQHDNTLAHLREQYDLQVRAIAQYKEALEAAQKKHDAAVTVGDAEKIKQAQEEINNATVALKNAQAAVASTRGAINKTEEELLKLQQAQKLVTAGWEKAVEKQKNAENALTNLNKQINAADANYKRMTAELNAESRSYSAVNKAIAEHQNSVIHMTQQYNLQCQAIKQYGEALDAAKNKLIAATKAGDKDKIREAKNEVIDATAAIRAAEAELITLDSTLKTQTSSWYSMGVALDAAGNKMTEIGEGAISLGKTLTTYVTAPITTILGYAVKSSISYESAFTGVRKTVNATEEEYEQLSAAIQEMAYTTGSSVETIAAVMATGGQLGIATKNLEKFTQVMVDLGNTTVDLNADQAATTIAKFINIMGREEYSDKVEKIGSSLVALGNNMATTESDVITMAQRIAGTGAKIGMTAQEVLAFAATLSSLGIESQMGGTAISKALTKMEVAVATSTKEATQQLKDFASVSGVTVDEFKRIWNDNPAQAFMLFISGLADMEKQGKSSIAVLTDMGMSEVRLRDTLLRSVNGVDLFSEALALSNNAWDKNNNLTSLADKRYATVANRLSAVKEKAKQFARQFGDDLLPTIKSLLQGVADFIDKFMNIDDATRTTIEKIALIGATIGPVVLALGLFTKTIGFALTSIGKFATGIATGASALVKFASFLASAPGLVLTFTAGIIYLNNKLYDIASGAKEAREALETLSDAADEWEKHSADTFYSRSKGLEAFGLTANDFAQNFHSAEQWMQDVIEEWSDKKVETTETVKKYVDQFKESTSELKSGINGLREAAVDAGQKDLVSQMDKDMKVLDQIDKKVNNLLNKRKEDFLSEKDIAELNALISQRKEIEIKYNLVQSDTAGFDKIAQAAQAAAERSKQIYGYVTIDVYEDAMVAAAEGMSAVNKQLDAEYDRRYALVQLMEKGETQEKALAELNEWYSKKRQEAYEAYCATVKNFSPELMTEDRLSNVMSTMGELYGLLADYDSTNPKALSDFISKMDENELTEVYALLSQIQELVSNGMSIEEALDGTGIDAETYKTLWEQLDAIGDELSTLDTDEYISKIKAIFGDLSSEVVKIATDLDMTGAKRAWATFAADPGADVFTTAYINKIDGKDQTFTVSNVTAYTIGTMKGVTGDGKTFTVTNATVNADGTLKGVDGNGKTFTATNCTINADGTLTGVDGKGKEFTVTNCTVKTSGTITAVTGDGKTFTVTNATVNADGTLTGVDGKGKTFTATNCTVNADGTLTGVDGSGKTFTVKNCTIYANATLNGVTGNGETFTVTNATVNADGTLTGVDGNGDTFTATNCTVNAEGVLTGVDGNGKTFIVTNATVYAPTTLQDIDTDAIKSWKTRNTTAVNLSGAIEMPVTAVWGDNWYSNIGTLSEDGKLALYSITGARIPVTAEMVSKLTASDIVVGVDENGIYHIIVKPEWTDTAKEEVEESFEAAKDGFESIASYVNALLHESSSNSWAGFWKAFSGQLPRAEDVKDLDKVKTAILEIVSAAEQGVDLSSIDGIADVVFDVADAITIWQKNGENRSFITGLTQDLKDLGIEVKESTLVDYLYRLANAELIYRGSSDAYDQAVQKRVEAEREAALATTHAFYGITSDAEKEAKAVELMSKALTDWMGFRQALEDNNDSLAFTYESDGSLSQFSSIELAQVTGIYNQLKEKIATEGEGALTELDQQFMAMFESLVKLMGDKDIAEECGIDIGEGIGAGMAKYDSTGDATKLIEGIDQCIRAAAGAHSPATKFIPIGEDISEGIEKGISNEAGLISDAASTAVAKAKSAAGGYYSNFYYIGRQIAAGIAEGIANNQYTVVNQIKKLAAAAVNAAKEELKINSPSRVFRDEVGVMVMRGFSEGVTSETESAANAIRNASRYLTNEAAGTAARTSSQNTYNYSTDASISFAGANFTVRDDSDIYSLAREISLLTKRTQSGRGTK